MSGTKIIGAVSSLGDKMDDLTVMARKMTQTRRDFWARSLFCGSLGFLISIF